jgi:hypothetical protein
MTLNSRLIVFVGTIASMAILAILPAYFIRSGRRRFVSIIRAMSEKGRTDIDGQTAEHWVEILDQRGEGTIAVIETMVLIYGGREWFFVNGIISRATGGKSGAVDTQSVCFLIAVGEPAVSFMAEQGDVFRLLVGSKGLAAYSVYHWSAFINLLTAERG